MRDANLHHAWHTHIQRLLHVHCGAGGVFVFVWLAEAAGLVNLSKHSAPT
jgi:hypothetical protein